MQMPGGDYSECMGTNAMMVPHSYTVLWEHVYHQEAVINISVQPAMLQCMESSNLNRKLHRNEELKHPKTYRKIKSMLQVKYASLQKSNEKLLRQLASISC